MPSPQKCLAIWLELGWASLNFVHHAVEGGGGEVEENTSSLGTLIPCSLPSGVLWTVSAITVYTLVGHWTRYTELTRSPGGKLRGFPTSIESAQCKTHNVNRGKVMCKNRHKIDNITNKMAVLHWVLWRRCPGGPWAVCWLQLTHATCRSV
jgi:hypothetical protein